MIPGHMKKGRQRENAVHARAGGLAKIREKIRLADLEPPGLAEIHESGTHIETTNSRIRQFRLKLLDISTGTAAGVDNCVLVIWPLRQPGKKIISGGFCVLKVGRVGLGPRGKIGVA